MALKVRVIAGLLLCAGVTLATAQDMKPPSFSVAPVDWDAALATLDKIEGLQAEPAKAAEPDEASDRTTLDLIAMLARLNRATAQRFPNIAASPIPVLLPFDVSGYLRDQAAGNSVDEPAERYFSGFRPSRFFLAGPPGYDAAFTIRPADVPGLAVDRADEFEIQITGAAQLYELDGAIGAEEKPVNGLAAEFPGIRRIYLESHMRYIFVRYGVTYGVSILCFDGHAPRRWLSCRDADPIAIRFLKALRLAGGTPHPQLEQTKMGTIERPDMGSSAFAYYGPGQLLPGTGFRRHRGDANPTVYAKIRFPLATGPAQVYSQMFVNSGDCTQAATAEGTVRRGGHPFHCGTGDKVPDGDGPKTYAHPWRDNFCEMRDFSVGQCPGGSGHQGEDIVPAECAFDGDAAQRCDADRIAVVAVYDGTVLRMAGQEGLVIAANAANTHIRFRYLHMNPKMLDDAGLLSGRTVSVGDVIGKVGNYSGHDAGTSYHVHFDMQVFTRNGWVLVNPYPTLVGAYERLIEARGEELKDPAVDVVADLQDTHPALERSARPRHIRKRHFGRGRSRIRHRYARR
jgi:hypothetical protein